MSVCVATHVLPATIHEALSGVNQDSCKQGLRMASPRTKGIKTSNVLMVVDIISEASLRPGWRKAF